MSKMKELELKYGCNPNQKPARVFMADGSELPFEVLCGRPGYINLLDALNSWQLVKELREALGVPAAASFKHVSPAGAAIGLPLTENQKKACFVDDIEGLDDSPLACAYARARGTDRMCSFGDWIALSDECDEVTARIIKREVSDGVIAPGYSEKALELLRQKKKGNYNIVRIDPAFAPPEKETRQVFGVSFEQGHNFFRIDRELLSDIVTDRELLPADPKTGVRRLPEEAVRDLIVALITLKYTQSNSVCYAHDGQAIGIGAGQQSRIHCTRLAGGKADTWFLRQHKKVLGLPFKTEIKRADRDNVIDAYINKNEEDCCADGVWQKYFTEQPERFTDAEQRAYLDSITGVSCGSDAFFPFFDNVQRAAASGVSYIAQPGGSIRDDAVTECCNRLGITMVFTGTRLFHH